MKRFVEGVDRSQSTLFPSHLDDYVSEDNPVRVIDAFIDRLDLLKLGFEGVQPAKTGRPSYHPSVLLKLYVYGYLNRIQSSRRLERETHRNIELMWLTRRLTPDFKTIADFRKDYGEAIQNVCRQFVLLCRQMDLFESALVAIDGSKFKAVNNRGKNYTRTKVKDRIKQIEKSTRRYLNELDRTDRDEPDVAEAKAARLKDKLNSLDQEMERLEDVAKTLPDTPDQQISLTDPDARAMATSARGTGVVGYNVQAAVDTEHHLIVTHEVTNVVSDRSQLSKMAKLARDAMAVTDLGVIADRGYFKGEEVLACHQAGITTYMPRTQTSSAQAEGRFGKPDFVYLPADDAYQCPAGERLVRHGGSMEDGKKLHHYWNTAACARCTIKASCTPSKERRVRRWEHENVIEAMQRRVDLDRDKMRLRSSTVEHPFGTLKAWMGATHFLTMTLDRVSTEMSLHVLAYNMKRMINLVGVESLIEAILTCLQKASVLRLSSCFRAILTRQLLTDRRLHLQATSPPAAA